MILTQEGIHFKYDLAEKWSGVHPSGFALNLMSCVFMPHSNSRLTVSVFPFFAAYKIANGS